MAYSRNIRVGNGVTNQFALNLTVGYLKEADVTCRVGTEVDGLGQPTYRQIDFISETLVQISGAIPEDGVQVVFDRNTDKDELAVDFASGDTFTEENLDTAHKQLLFITHEILDGKIPALETVAPSLATVLEAVDDVQALADTVAADKLYISSLAAGVQPLVNTITELKTLTTSDISAGRRVSIRYGSIYGGYGDSEFYVLSGTAVSNGLVNDNVVVVQNNAGTLTFVRKRFKDEGIVDLLWFTPFLDYIGDSGTSYVNWAAAVNAQMSAQGRIKGIIPNIGKPFLTSQGGVLSGNVKLTGGGTLEAHASMPQGTNLLRNTNLFPAFGVRTDKDFIFDDIHFDGGDRAFVAAGRQSLVRLFSVEGVKVRGGATFSRQESNLLALAGCSNINITDSEFYDWGYPVPAAGIDPGSAIIVIANPATGTFSQDVTIENNSIHDGRWNGIQLQADNFVIAGNRLHRILECGMFIRDLSIIAPGNYGRVGVVANNLITDIPKAFVDAAALALGCSRVICTGNTVRNCDNIGISVVSETAVLKLENNLVINGNMNKVDFPNGGGIVLRDALPTNTPINISIKFNTVVDEQALKTAKYGIAIYNAGGPVDAFSNIDVSGNTVVGAAALAADNLYIDPQVITSTWRIEDNVGASTWERVNLLLFGNVLATIGAFSNATTVLANGNTIFGPSFDPAAVEAGVMYWQLPPDWDGGKVFAKFIGTTPGTAGSVVWGISANAFANGENLDIVHPASVTVTAGMNTNLLSVSPRTGPVTIGNTPSPGDHVALRLARIGTDAADTAPGDAVLFSVELYYGRTSYNPTWLG